MVRIPPDENREQRRAEIVRAGLALLESGGLERLSLRGVAREMGVQAPGLYWYIASKQELVDLMAKAIIDEAFPSIEPPAAGETWQAWLARLSVGLRKALLAHRDGARVVAGAYLFQTNAITPLLELALEILEGAGFERIQAMIGTTTVMRYTMGIALDEQASPPIPRKVPVDGGVPPEGGPPIDAERFPRIAAVMRDFIARMDRDPGERAELHFLRGLELIISGVGQMRNDRGKTGDQTA